MWWCNLPSCQLGSFHPHPAVPCFICKMSVSSWEYPFRLPWIKKEKHPKLLILSICLLLTLALGSPPKAEKEANSCFLEQTHPQESHCAGQTRSGPCSLLSPRGKKGEQRWGTSSSSGISLETMLKSISIPAGPCSLQRQVTLTFTKLVFSQKHYWNCSTSCKLHQIWVVWTMLSRFAKMCLYFSQTLQEQTWAEDANVIECKPPHHHHHQRRWWGRGMIIQTLSWGSGNAKQG